MLRARAQSRLNEQRAKLREVHVELDSIEARLAGLRAHQAAFLLKAAAPKPTRGTAETIDLRTLDEVSATSSELDDVTAKKASVTETKTRDDDFDKRFAAFAAGENDDMSRRWLDG